MNDKNYQLLFLNLLLIAFTFSSCRPPQSEENNVSQENTTGENDLPSMEILTLEGQKVMVKEQKGKLVLVMFQPDCDDCQREAVQIRENMEAFKGYSLYFVSSAPLPLIANFSSDYKLNTFDNIVFAQTTVQNVINTLGPISAPSVYIFSAEGKLVKSFTGETDINEIKSFL